MKIYISKITVVLCFLFLGIGTQAATNDCLLDVFHAELKEKNSKELDDYFSDKLNKSKEDLNKAYNAWQVLYKADKNADRFNINNLEELVFYMKRSILNVDALAVRIENAGGYDSFKKTVFWSASQTDEPYGIALLKDLESSEEIAKMLAESPDLLNSWKVLYELEVSNTFRQRAANVNAMHNHIEKIHKDEDKFTLHHLNEFVKHALNKDAYMESVLFPGKLYGGIQVPQELILDIKPLSSNKSFLVFKQYTGTEANIGYFGTYEVRINTGKIQRHIVDDSGVGSWKNLNVTGDEVVDFVITADGRLRLGKGHHNLSGEAEYVISAGEMVITDGVVTEIANNSGHYSPSNENLYDTEKIFKAFGVTNDDFKLDIHPYADEKTPPIKNTNNDNVVELWTNSLPSELKSQLLENKDELYDLFKNADVTQREEYTKSWQVLRKAADLYFKANYIVKLSKIADRFKYRGKEGFEALVPLFNSYVKHGMPDMDELGMEMEIVNKLDELRSMFNNDPNLPISFTCIDRNFHPNPAVLDGVADEIIGVEGKKIVKKKFFDSVDASYEKVGEYDGIDILRKGDEIGFKSADVINIFEKK